MCDQMVFQFRCEWKIESYSEDPDFEKISFSPNFYASPDDICHRWRLLLWYDPHNNSSILQLYLDDRTDQQLIIAKFSYKLYDKENELVDDGSTGGSFKMGKYKKIIKIQKPIEPCKFKCIRKVCVDIELARSPINHSRNTEPVNTSSIPEKVSRQINNPNQLVKSLQDDLFKLYESKHFTDSTILCGDREFYVHKAILASRSTVFRSNFENVHAKIIHHDDIDPATLDVFLKFLYTGDLQFQDHMIDDILNLSQKYNVQELIQLCESKMIQTISVSTAVEFLMTADKLGMSVMMSSARKFIKENLRDVSETKAWTDALIQRPDLMALLLNSIVLNEEV